jgi:hypothetical protein
MTLSTPFRPLFHYAIWVKGQILFTGAILATGKRTGTATLRVMGSSHEGGFSQYHQVLNRAVWSPHRPAEILLALLIHYLDKSKGALVLGIDETIERRWGARIIARGIYRDAVCSSQSHFVKTCPLLTYILLLTYQFCDPVWYLNTTFAP